MGLFGNRIVWRNFLAFGIFAAVAAAVATNGKKISNHQAMSDKTKIVVPASEKQTATIIFLHGLGDSGHGWSEIAADMQMPWAKFIFPHAPKRAVTINGGARMPAWFDLLTLDVGGQDDVEGFKQTHEYVSGLINAEIAAGISSSRIILGGFSQGGAQSVYSSLRFDKPLAGCLCLSAWCAVKDSYPKEIHPSNSKLPIFMGHGKEDTLVLPEYGRLSHEFLQSFGLPVELKMYKMAHSSCPQEMRDLKQFLHSRLPKSFSPDAGVAAASVEPIPADLSSLSVKELKEVMKSHNISAAGCVEKDDLIQRIEENRK